MNRKLTAQQVKSLVSFQKNAPKEKGRAATATVRFLRPDEAANILPGIVTHHTVTVRRPPTETRSRE